MLSGRLRRELSRIVRGLEPTASTEPPAPPLPEAGEEQPVAAPSSPEPFALQYDPLEIGVIVETTQGPCLEVRPPLEQLDDYAERHARLRATRGEAPLFLDIETCGLAAAPLFLIGVATVTEEAIVLRQFLARDYTEEAAVLQAFRELGAEHAVWVSFNGAAFDLPFIRDRAGFHHVTIPEPRAHTDILPPARRRWRGQFPDCRLATLELHVCNRRRYGDIPGAEIPGVYHDFVRDENWASLAPVLQHNALDILTMADLWLTLRGG